MARMDHATCNSMSKSLVHRILQVKLFCQFKLIKHFILLNA